MIPSFLAEDNSVAHFPNSTLEQIISLDSFIVERSKTARRFLRAIGFDKDFESVQLQELDKHSRDDVDALLKPCLQGIDVGLISEAGVPGVADPGGLIIRAAQAKRIKVVPLIGGSSILLALMASGMNGQHFEFHGYLPRNEQELAKSLKMLEAKSIQDGCTQIFIETPYRNDRMMESLKKYLHPNTDVCIASNITASDELIITKTISEWRKTNTLIGKKPTVFLLYSGKLES